MTLLQEVTYERFDPQEDPHHRFHSLITCYQAVFAGSPWDEWLKCGECGRKFGSDHVQKLIEARFECCGRPLEEFWPSSTVATKIIDSLRSKDQSSCWIAIQSDLVIGFCFGVILPVSEFDAKLELPGLSEKLAGEYGDASFAYQVDMGVLPRFRRKGIARGLYENRLGDFRERGVTVGIVRTKTLPPSVTYTWFNGIGYQVVASYDDSDGRVIQGCFLDSLQG